MRILFNFLIPGSVLIAGTLFFLNSSHLSQIDRFQVDFGAAILFILCALLAWRFDRSRIIYALQSLLYTEITIRYIDGPYRSSLLVVIVILLLANLFFVALLKERGIHSLRGMFITSLPIIQAAVLLYYYNSAKNLNIPQFETSFLNLPANLTTVPETVLILIVVALAAQWIRFLRYPNPLEGALFWIIVAVIASLFYPAGIQTTVLRAASILALIISFIEMSHTLAYWTELTGLPGRRALMETFLKLGGHYTIAMVDIDFFKKFNDTHGHDVGDQVLKMVAMRLAKCTGGGRAFRYGGEEFCIVFFGKDLESCLDHIEGVRSLIADQPFSIRKLARPLKKPKKPAQKKRKQNTVSVTVSIGVAEKTSTYNQPEVVMKRSDQALYRAKETGRNKVCS